MQVEQGPQVAHPDLQKMKVGGESVTASELADHLQQHYEQTDTPITVQLANQRCSILSDCIKDVDIDCQGHRYKMNLWV